MNWNFVILNGYMKYEKFGTIPKLVILNEVVVLDGCMKCILNKIVILYEMYFE